MAIDIIHGQIPSVGLDFDKQHNGTQKGKDRNEKKTMIGDLNIVLQRLVFAYFIIGFFSSSP